MRGGKSLLVLLLLALGLGGYAYFVESKKDTTASTTKKDSFVTVDSTKVDELEVHSASGDDTTLKKAGADWQISAPDPGPADNSDVNSLLTTLGSLEASRTINDKPTSVKEFGLDPARFSVAYKLAGETTWHKVNFGSKTPTGADLYARIDGQPKLVTVGGFVEDSLNRTAFDLRDKSVLKFQRESVDGVTIEANGAPAVSLAKKGADWALTAPVAARAEFNSVDGLIGQLVQAKMKAIVPTTAGAPTPAELKTFGAGSTRASLAIGGKKDDTTLYARDLARPIVFTVEPALLDQLKKTADDFRVKDVFEFRGFNATSMDFTVGGQSFSFAKSKPPAPAAPKAGETPPPAPPDVWKQTKPSAKDADTTKMTDLLTDLSNLRAQSFTTKPLDKGDEVTVVAHFGDGSEAKDEHVTFRKSGDVVQAMRADEKGAVVVPTADYDKAIGELKALTGVK
jgi:hypothetical protein